MPQRRKVINEGVSRVSTIRGSCGIWIDSERRLAMMQALIHRYTQLRDDAREQLGKGHFDTLAYGNIVNALSELVSKHAVLIKIAAAQDAIDQDDQRNWERREGYRGF